MFIIRSLVFILLCEDISICKLNEENNMDLCKHSSDVQCVYSTTSFVMISCWSLLLRYPDPVIY